MAGTPKIPQVQEPDLAKLRVEQIAADAARAVITLGMGVEEAVRKAVERQRNFEASVDDPTRVAGLMPEAQPLTDSKRPLTSQEFAVKMKLISSVRERLEDDDLS